jgi:hypothetical protein
VTVVHHQAAIVESLVRQKKSFIKFLSLHDNHPFLALGVLSPYSHLPTARILLHIFFFPPFNHRRSRKTQFSGNHRVVHSLFGVLPYLSTQLDQCFFIHGKIGGKAGNRT